MITTKNFKRLLIFLISTSVLFCSCTSNELTRSKAEQLIKEKFQYPRDMSFQACTTRVAVSNDPGYAHRIALYNDYFNRLQDIGVLTYTTDLSVVPGFTTFLAKFTDKGNPFVAGPEKQGSTGVSERLVDVKIGYLSFDKITGIVEQKVFNITEVQYTEKVELTPFGQILDMQQVFNKTATFTKYDDGWRINN